MTSSENPIIKNSQETLIQNNDLLEKSTVARLRRARQELGVSKAQIVRKWLGTMLDKFEREMDLPKMSDEEVEEWLS